MWPVRWTAQNTAVCYVSDVKWAVFFYQGTSLSLDGIHFFSFKLAFVKPNFSHLLLVLQTPSVCLSWPRQLANSTKSQHATSNNMTTTPTYHDSGHTDAPVPRTVNSDYDILDSTDKNTQYWTESSQYVIQHLWNEHLLHDSDKCL